MTSGAAEFIRSRRLAVALLIAAAILAASGTLFAPPVVESAFRSRPWLLAAARFVGVVETYRSPVFLLLVALIGLSMSVCTWHRAAPLLGSGGPRAAGLRRTRLALDAAMHLSLMVVVAGGVGKGLWGSVRTMNVHVGGSTEAFYDFTLDRDVPLGFTVKVLERQDAWHPLRAMIGVSDVAAGTKIGLVEAVEGRSVVVPGVDLSLRLAVDDPAGRLLRLSAAGGGRTGTLELETAEGGKSAADFGPLRVTLVAWRRDIKDVRSLISCTVPGSPPQVGWISPRERVTCRGVGFAMTAWGTDPDDKPYVGIQAVRDPAAPLFWGGCIAFVVSLVLFLATRKRESRREAVAPGLPGTTAVNGPSGSSSGAVE